MKQPTLTRTLYMTPTLCVNNWQSEMEARYDSTGISACLAREVENTMHAFVTAVKNGDKEAITTLVEYPVLMANNENDVWASNEEEFLAGYDLIFTPDMVARISRAKMDDVMGEIFLIWCVLALRVVRMVYNIYQRKVSSNFLIGIK